MKIHMFAPRNPDRNSSTPSKQVSLWQLLGVLLLVSIAFSAYVFWPNTPTQVAQALNPYERIMKKLSAAPVKSKYSPVFIYYTYDGVKTFPVGSGSVFDAPEGKLIVSVEHLLYVGLESKEFGSPTFAWRSLRPLDPNITGWVTGIQNRANDILPPPSEAPDALVLKTGTKSAPIKCYYTEAPGLLKNETDVYPTLTRGKFLTSLLTGEKVEIIGGEWTKGEHAVKYTLINYQAGPGESGSGFVDEYDHLYILRGELPSLDPNGSIAKGLGNPKFAAIVFGPVDPTNR